MGSLTKIAQKLLADLYRIKAPYCSPSYDFRKYTEYRNERYRLKGEFYRDLLFDFNLVDNEANKRFFVFVYSNFFTKTGFRGIYEVYQKKYEK